MSFSPSLNLMLAAITMRIPLVAVVATKKHGEILEQLCAEGISAMVNDVKDNRFYKSNFYFGLADAEPKLEVDKPAVKKPNQKKNKKGEDESSSED